MPKGNGNKSIDHRIGFSPTCWVHGRIDLGRRPKSPMLLAAYFRNGTGRPKGATTDPFREVVLLTLGQGNLRRHLQVVVHTQRRLNNKAQFRLSADKGRSALSSLEQGGEGVDPKPVLLLVGTMALETTSEKDGTNPSLEEGLPRILHGCCRKPRKDKKAQEKYSASNLEDRISRVAHVANHAESPVLNSTLTIMPGRFPCCKPIFRDKGNLEN